MKTNSDCLLRERSVIIEKAKELGASLAGFARIDDLKTAPSFTFTTESGPGYGGGPWNTLNEKRGEVYWPAGAKSVLIIAVSHPADKPGMDWWFGPKDPPGNRLLKQIIAELCTWVGHFSSIRTYHMPYHVEVGGTFLKDASVLAGLGCIGRNNLLVTPEYGPRVRMRAMTLSESFYPTGPIDFDPCIGCDAPCRQPCPQNAFDHRIDKTAADDIGRLPGRSGAYSRPMCHIQMEKDIAAAGEKIIGPAEKAVKIIKYCRRCEFACPVGK